MKYFITLFLSFSICMYIITQFGSFHNYWNKRIIEHRKANRFLKTETKKMKKIAYKVFTS